MAERDDDGFLGRWSRRKLEARRSEAEEEAPEAETEAEPEDPTAEPERHPAEDVDIDNLGRGSDFKMFMEKGVAPETRRKALQKLWRSNPVFANLDGLDDYFDLARPERHGLGPVRGTAWKIGRGFLTEDEAALPSERPEPVEETEAAEAAAEDERDGPETEASGETRET